MTYLGALALGLVVHHSVRERLNRVPALGIAAAASLLAAAPATFPFVAAGGMFVAYRHRRLRRREAEIPDDPGTVGRILFIGLSAGLPLAAALDLATGEVGPLTASQIQTILRRGRRIGLAAALAGAEGPASRLFQLLARAQVSGASTARAVAAFVDEERSVRRAQARELAQRLPVKLTVPLALLILPGFVMLTIGPTVVATVQRLLGPFLS